MILPVSHGRIDSDDVGVADQIAILVSRSRRPVKMSMLIGFTDHDAKRESSRWDLDDEHLAGAEPVEPFRCSSQSSLAFGVELGHQSNRVLLRYRMA